MEQQRDTRGPKRKIDPILDVEDLKNTKTRNNVLQQIQEATGEKQSATIPPDPEGSSNQQQHLPETRKGQKKIRVDELGSTYIGLSPLQGEEERSGFGFEQTAQELYCRHEASPPSLQVHWGGTDSLRRATIVKHALAQCDQSTHLDELTILYPPAEQKFRFIPTPHQVPWAGAALVKHTLAQCDRSPQLQELTILHPSAERELRFIPTPPQVPWGGAASLLRGNHALAQCDQSPQLDELTILHPSAEQELWLLPTPCDGDMSDEQELWSKNCEPPQLDELTILHPSEEQELWLLPTPCDGDISAEDESDGASIQN